MQQEYQKPFYLSLTIHGLIFLLLLLNNIFTTPQIIRLGGGKKETINLEKPIIQAGLVSDVAVKDAIRRQEQQELNKQKQFALQKAQAEKLKKEAEQAKIIAEKLQKDLLVAQKKAKQEQQLALVAKANAEQATLQAIKEQEKVKQQQINLAKEKAAQKLAKEKQAKLKEQEAAKYAQEQAANNRKQALAAKARQLAEQARYAKELALQQSAAAERGRWLDNEFTHYVGEIERKIEENRTISTAFTADLSCDIQIKLLPDGSVHNVKLIRSSGNVAYDSMSEAAVYKAAPFAMPEDTELIAKLRDIVLVFKVASDDSIF